MPLIYLDIKTVCIQHGKKQEANSIHTLELCKAVDICKIQTEIIIVKKKNNLGSGSLKHQTVHYGLTQDKMPNTASCPEWQVKYPCPTHLKHMIIQVLLYAISGCPSTLLPSQHVS